MSSDTFALRSQFLTGTYQAARAGSVSEPEWPPEPARVHAALIAAGWALGRDRFPADAYAALSWLERLPPPALAYTSRIEARTAPEVFVPRNLTPAETRDVLSALRAGRNPARLSGRVARRFPTSVPGDQPVWFVWRANPAEHWSTLERLAREVQYLGSSRSPVCCDLSKDTPDVTLIPATGSGTHALRVPHSGFTDELLAKRGTHPAPTLGAFAAYRPAEAPAQMRMTHAGSPFGELVVRAFDPIFPFTILHASAIARAFREAVLARAGDEAPSVLHGHGCNPHVAFLPLANVGHSHASGQVLGVAAAIPREVSLDDRAVIVKAVNSVDKLHNLGTGAWRLKAGADRSVRTLAPSRWTRPARRWQSVTPVILDRHPKRRGQEALKDALNETFVNAGMPKPERIWCSRISWQAAAVPAPAYAEDSLPDGLRVHVDVGFPEPVRGPLLVGRGRYFGVGLFAPVGNRSVSDGNGIGA
ncbi:MAG TPA: type I-U CRISPR-associated protein Csb2 [Solirubrobacteraceae bacterium]|jgi:CRISPR-associated protein Csb2|nr:type I-U CRISPR-associated protein Csb2 [Solirubrobacteraceae bacterium]